MKNRCSMIFLASLIAAPAVISGEAAIGQTVGGQAVAAIPEAATITARPDPETLPGIRLWGSGGADLGVVERIVRHGGEAFALVTIGEGVSKIGTGFVAVPTRNIRVDDQKLTYDISWARFQSLPVYDGTTPTWMAGENES